MTTETTFTPTAPHRKCAIIGYASDVGGTVPGSAQGSLAIRGQNIESSLSNLGWTVEDMGDIKTADTISLNESMHIKNLASIEEGSVHELLPVYCSCRDLASYVKKALERNMLPVVLGGDHSLSIGSIAAVANHYASINKRIGVLWVDTHPDLNSPATSPSKRIFGMSTAVLLGQVPGVLSSLQSPSPAIRHSDIAYIGLREVDPAERSRIKDLGLKAYTMKDIDTRGIAEVVLSAIAEVTKETCGFVLSFDLDVCDPNLAPGTGTPKRGGLTFREAHLIMELVADSGNLLSLEMVELNPLLDNKSKTAGLAASLIESCLGKSIL